MIYAQLRKLGEAYLSDLPEITPLARAKYYTRILVSSLCSVLFSLYCNVLQVVGSQ